MAFHVRDILADVDGRARDVRKDQSVGALLGVVRQLDRGGIVVLMVHVFLVLHGLGNVEEVLRLLPVFLVKLSKFLPTLYVGDVLADIEGRKGRIDDGGGFGALLCIVACLHRAVVVALVPHLILVLHFLLVAYQLVVERGDADEQLSAEGPLVVLLGVVAPFARRVCVAEQILADVDCGIGHVRQDCRPGRRLRQAAQLDRAVVVVLMGDVFLVLYFL